MSICKNRPKYTVTLKILCIFQIYQKILAATSTDLESVLNAPPEVHTKNGKIVDVHKGAPLPHHHHGTLEKTACQSESMRALLSFENGKLRHSPSPPNEPKQPHRGITKKINIPQC